MRHVIPYLVLILCLAITQNAEAQMDKKEKKEWKKKMKSLTPEQYKALLDENKALKDEIREVRNSLNGVDEQLADKDATIQQYQSQLTSMRSEVALAKKRIGELEAGGGGGSTAPRGNTGGGIDDSKGVVFKVQIGAFKGVDIKKYDQGGTFGAENQSGMNKYTLGVFRDYWEADTFKKYLREMGVKDAWIVSYKDGRRVPIKDVLEGII